MGGTTESLFKKLALHLGMRDARFPSRRRSLRRNQRANTMIARMTRMPTMMPAIVPGGVPDLEATIPSLATTSGVVD